jgi:hypothetical protein
MVEPWVTHQLAPRLKQTLNNCSVTPEVSVAVHILNRMLELGRPIPVRCA